MKKVKVKNKRKKIIMVVMVLIAVVLIAASFAWYLYNKKNEAEQYVEVMTPYFLYLMNADDENSLEFAVGNLHPGETKQVIICVTNKRPENEQDDNNVEIARESKFLYDLEFAFTQNLAVNYNIYELEKVQGEIGTASANAIFLEGVTDAYWIKKGDTPLTDFEDVSSERHSDAAVFGTTDVSDIWNAGKYLLYQNDSHGEELQLEYKYNGNTGTFEYEFDYYLVEIEWQSNITFSDYSKETDLVYVVVNAKQVEPTLQE